MIDTLVYIERMGDTAPASAGRVGASLPLDMRDLQAFVEVAQSGSFRIAAAKLYTSQPSVSRAVARLESELNVQLLDRGPRGARVTARGAVMLEGARRLLASANTLRRDVTELGRSSIRLGATATSARTVLAPVLSRWMPKHPDVAVTAIEDGEVNLAAKLRAGDCDAAIVSGPVDQGTLDALKITTVSVIALFPPGHHLGTTAAPIGLVELAAEPLLWNGLGFPATQLLMREFRRLDVEPNVVYESSVGQTLAAMAEVGLGIAVFGDAADLRGFDLASRRILDVAGSEIKYDWYVAWSRSAPAWLREFAIDLSTTYRTSLHG